MIYLWTSLYSFVKFEKLINGGGGGGGQNTVSCGGGGGGGGSKNHKKINVLPFILNLWVVWERRRERYKTIDLITEYHDFT